MKKVASDKKIENIGMLVFPLLVSISFYLMHFYRAIGKNIAISTFDVIYSIIIIILETCSVFMLLSIFNIKKSKMFILLFSISIICNNLITSKLHYYNFQYIGMQTLTILSFRFFSKNKIKDSLLGIIFIFFASMINANSIAFLIFLLLLFYFLEIIKDEENFCNNKKYILISFIGIILSQILILINKSWINKIFGIEVNNFGNFNYFLLFKQDKITSISMNLIMLILTIFMMFFISIKNKIKKNYIKNIFVLFILIGIVGLASFSYFTVLFFYIAPVVLLNEIKIDENKKNLVISSIFGICALFYLNIMYNTINGEKLIGFKCGVIYALCVSFLIYTALLLITKKSYLTLKIMYVSTSVLLIISQIKMSVNNEPIYLSDAKFLLNIFDFPSLLINTSFIIILRNIFMILALCINFIVGSNVVKENKFEITNISNRVRIGITSFIFVVFALLFIPIKQTQQIYLNYFLCENFNKYYNDYTTVEKYYARYGFSEAMFGIYLNNMFFEPDGYDEEKLNSALKEVECEDTDEENLGTPNIIVIMSESFFDLSLLSEDTTFNINPTENFNNLKNFGKLVNLLSPSYGGRSENSVFELLTGGNCTYFQEGYIPIMSLYNKKTSSNIPSIIQLLNNSGYLTKTTFAKDYFVSSKAYSNMGFKEYRDLSNEVNIDKLEEPIDEKMTDIIIEDLEKNKEKYFGIYSMYENHMPYSKDKFKSYNITSVNNNNLNTSEKEALQSYAQGIYDSDMQLERLYEYINSIDEPTIILFLPDHLPFLYDKNYVNVFTKLKYFNSGDELEESYRKYNTQGLVLSNFDSDILNDIPSYIGYNYLLTYIANNMNIEKNSYYLWLEKMQNILPAYNRFVSVDNDGKIYSTNLLNEDMLDAFNLEKLMMYKLFINQ